LTVRTSVSGTTSGIEPKTAKAASVGVGACHIETETLPIALTYRAAANGFTVVSPAKGAGR
jgi:hypothetical protein